MHCPHCENEIQSPSDQWHLNTPWHCSFCGGMFGIRLDGEVTFPLIPNMQPLAPLLGESIARRFAFYSKPNHYVYALCYSSGLPFYVGVGYGYRCFSHSTETKITTATMDGEARHDSIAAEDKRGSLVPLPFLGSATRAGRVDRGILDKEMGIAITRRNPHEFGPSRHLH